MNTSSDELGLGPPPEDLETRRQRDEAGRALFGEHAPNLMRIGRFELETQLGSGGQGVVYLARDPKLGRPVALKRLTLASSRHVERMRQEALALAKVSHDNVVKVFEVDEDETGRPFLVMELVEGQSLREWVAAEPRVWTAVVDVFIAVGDGLAAVHEAGVIHRDIKPNNIMITSDGRAKLVDLGIASWREPDQSFGPGKSAEPPVLGTWGYMAPEQRRGQADARSDQFSFCVALHETLHGEPPLVTGYRREGTSAATEVTTTPEPRRVPQSAVDIRRAPRRLTGAIARGLLVDPAQRHPDMRVLVSILREVRSHRSRLLPIARVAIAAGLVAVALILSRSLTPPGPCTEPEASQRLWQGAPRDAVRSALERTGSAENAASFGAIDAMLSTAAAELDARREQACESDQDELTRARRLTQIAEQHERLARVVAELGELDEASLVELPERLATSLARLHAGPQDVCELQPPTLAEEELDETRALVRQGIAEGVVGSYDEGLRLMALALERAQGAMLEPLRAELRLERGRLALEARRLELARHELDEARSLAERHDCKGIGAEALALWTKACLLDPRPLTDGVEAASQQALEKLDALGDHDGPRRAEALNSRGLVYERQGRYDEALDALERAIAIREALVPPAPLELSDTLLNLGNVQGKQKRPAAAITTLERARSVREQALWPDHPSLYRIHASLSNRWREQGELERAEQAQLRALTLARGLGANHPRLANLHLGMAQLLDRQHEFDRALEHAKQADEVLTAVYGKDGLERLASLEAIGQVHLDAGQPSKAVPVLEESLALQATNHASALDLAIGRGKLARAHLRAGRYEVSLRLYEEAWRPFVEDPSLRSNSFLPELQLGRGEVRVALERRAEAVEPLRDAVAWWAERGDNPERLALARWLLAQLLCESGEGRDLAKLALDHYRNQETEAAARKRAAIEQWLELECPAAR